MNKIIQINEHYENEMEGYEVKTENDTYVIMIESGQCCCENWGYLVSEDDCEKFIGKELLSVDLTDIALNKKMIDDVAYGDGDFDNGGVQFVDFKCTDGSAFQIAVYNAHNGYYGHGILLKKNNEVLLDDCL